MHQTVIRRDSSSQLSKFATSLLPRLALRFSIAILALSTSPVTAQILIDYDDPNDPMHNASVLNGGFEDVDVSAGVAGDRLNYAEVPNWTNLSSVDQTLHDFVRTNVEFESDQNAVVTDFPDREAGIDTGHTISLGELFDFSYVWRDASAWDDAGDQVAFTFFTTADDTITGTVLSSYQFLSGLSTVNSTYESVTGSFLSTNGADVGKNLFISLNGIDGGGGADGFVRVDNVYLEASAAPSNLFVWLPDTDGSWNTGSNWNSDPSTPNAVDADVRFLSGSVTDARTITVNSSSTANMLTFEGDNQYTLATAASQTLTLAESSGGAADAEIAVSSGTHVISGSLAGSVGFDKTGSGTLRLSGDNSALSGGISISGGDLRTNNTAGIGSNAIDIASGAFLYLEGDPNGTGYSGTFNNTLTGSGEIRIGENASSETVTIGSGTSAHAGAITVRGGVVIADQATDFGTTDRPTWINQTTGELRLDGSGGNISTAENFNIGSRADTTAPHLVSTAGNNTITGTVTGTNGDGNHIISVAAGSTLTIDSTISEDNENGTFVFQGDGDVTIGNSGTPGSGKLIGDNVNVVKQGTGNLTIATATTDPNEFYGGTTTIEAGTLTVLSNGTNGGELRSSNIQVQSGTTLDVDDFGDYSLQVGQALGGAGTVVAQTVSIFDDTIVTPGDSIGTLNITGNVTMDSFSATPSSDFGMTFELGSVTTVGSGVNDLIDISGSLTINTNSGANAFNVNISPVDGTLATGIYRLIDAAGGSEDATGSDFNVDLVDSQGNSLGVSRQTLTVDPNTAGQLNLVVGGTAFDLFYVSGNWETGGGVIAWDTVAPVANDEQFFALDSVNFTDGSANKAVNISGNVAPSSVTIDNSSGNDYTFSGPGAIIGSAGITKSGTGTATLSNTDPNSGLGGNTFSGGIQVNAGTLVLDSDQANFSGGINIADGATLDIGVSANGTAKNVLTNAGGHGTINTNTSGTIRVFDSEFILSITGSGTLLVEEEASDFGPSPGYDGNIVIKNGADFEIFDPNAMGTTVGSTTVEAGGRLFVDDSEPSDINSNENLTLAGFGRDGQAGNEGALQVGGASSHTFNGTISLSADTRLRTGNADGVMNVAGSITGTGTNLVLHPEGTINISGPVNLGSGGVSITDSGTANLSGAMTYSGDTDVNAGTLALSGSASLSSSANVNVSEGATLDVQGIGTAVLSSQNLTGQGTVTGNLSVQSGSTVSPGGNTTVDVAVAQDVRIQEGDPNANFDGSRMVTGYTNSSGLGRSLIEFDMASGLPAGVTVLGGDLVLPVGFFWEPGQPGTVRVNAHELDTSFVEGEATWNIASSGSSWTTSGGDFNATVLGESQELNPDTVDGGDTAIVSGANLDAAIVANASSSSFDMLLKLDPTSEAGDPNTFNAVWFNSTSTGNPKPSLRVEIFDPTSTLTIDGDYIQSAGATLEIDLASTTEFDVLDVSGALTAGGTLDVDLVGGFDPNDGDQFEILNFASASGSFAFDLPTLSGGLSWDTSSLLSTGILEVVASVDADFNNDGIVNGLDFLVWQRGDSPQGGSSDELLAWQDQYGNPSPTTPTSSVPEPTSVVLLAIGLALGLANRRNVRVIV